MDLEILVSFGDGFWRWSGVIWLSEYGKSLTPLKFFPTSITTALASPTKPTTTIKVGFK